jgi:hypothetical protein
MESRHKEAVMSGLFSAAVIGSIVLAVLLTFGCGTVGKVPTLDDLDHATAREQLLNK